MGVARRPALRPEPPRGPALGNVGQADRRAALSLVPVSRETEERLAVYVDLLLRWQRIKNLVGPSTLDTIWTRHIADSAQLLNLAPEARRWVDLGSGAGFPGLVVAIMLQGRAGVSVDLIESNERKCAFLREAVRTTGAPARVHMGRIDSVLPKLEMPVDVITSRALAPLPDLLALSETVLNDGALGMFMTGDDSVAALGGSYETGLSRSGAYEFETAPSKTHPSGRVILVRKAR